MSIGEYIRKLSASVMPINTLLGFCAKLLMGLGFIYLLFAGKPLPDPLPTVRAAMSEISWPLGAAVVGWFCAAYFGFKWWQAESLRASQETQSKTSRVLQDKNVLYLLDASNQFLSNQTRYKQGIVDTLITRIFSGDDSTNPPGDVAEHLDLVCTVVAQLFEKLTGQPCHCAVKVLANRVMVSTKARDELMHNNTRRQIDEHLKSYPYTDNSAFKEIIDGHQQSHFVCNDLKGTPGYKSTHKGYEKLYNAVLVLPISNQENPSAIGVDSTLGFVCVDSLFAIFDPEVHPRVLKLFAQEVHEVLMLLGKFGQKPEKRGK
jgi:hypothetical protein